MNRTTGLSILAAALILAAAACDFSPSAPFAGFEEEQQQGATLHGQIQQSGFGSISRQMAAPGYGGLRAVAAASDTDEPIPTKVVVYVGYTDGSGTEIGSVDIEDGAFTLRGLPGSFSLVFLDQHDVPIGDDPMYFDGVKPNQEIDIVVGMDGGGWSFSKRAEQASTMRVRAASRSMA